MMRATGGPLLCIGDLLSDVGEDVAPPEPLPPSPPPALSELGSSTAASRPSDLPKLFQENYDNLNEALARGDHSWTALTLKLCSSLEVANKLVQSTHGSARLLLEKVEELEKIVKRGDSAVASVKAITISSVGDGRPSVGREHVK
ncbi:uncharacterized protein LOC115676420 [Syzygium oleosum]|uniref:uncharacterized protein LOC115676420 n=1 Tax=Syzygium oleosum TaxID=219896 RepID=UPI0024BAEF4F|nr:uncharacterized protein LOC115676420 [Syzygium oleosum]